MTLIDRNSEITFLNNLLTDCAHGRGRVTTISGPTATGKTELVYAFSRRAVESGAVWLSATCSQNDQNVPLGVVSQLFHNAALPIAHASRAARLIEDAAPGARPPGERPDDSDWLRVTQGLWAIILELSKSSTVLITVDDVEYADSMSWQLLLNFVHRLKSANVFIVLTATEGLQGMNPHTEIDLMRHPHYERIRLAPLSLRGVERIISDSMGDAVAAKLGPACHKVSGGNPLLVKALVEDAVNGGGDPGELVVSDVFSRSVRALLYRSDPTMLVVARGLAILGEYALPSLLAELLDLTTTTVNQALNCLEAIGVLDPPRFRHASAREAVLDDLDPHKREEMHRRAAQLLHAEGAAATVIAEHLIGTSHFFQEPWALAELREAAEQALTNDRHEFAVRCLKFALELCDDDRQRTLTTTMLARAEWRLNPAAANRHVNRLMATARQKGLDFQELDALLRYLLWNGRHDEAVEVLEQMDVLATEPDADEEAARLDVLHRRLSSSHPLVLSRTRSVTGVGVGAGTGVVSPARTAWTATGSGPHAQAASLLASVLRDGPDDRTLGIAERVLHSTSLDDANLETVESALFALIYSDRPDIAAPWCDVMYSEAVMRGAPTWRAVLASLRAGIAIRQGDLVLAEEYARLALDIVPPRSLGVLVGLPLAVLIRANTEMGKYDVAAHHLRRPVPDTLLQTRFGLYYLQARAHYYLATNHSHAALDDFSTCGRLMRAWGLDTPSLVPWRHGAAAALLQTDQREQARALLQEPYDLPSGDSLRARGISQRLLAAASDLRQRPSMLREAIDMLQAAGDRLEMAYALVDLTHTLTELGEPNKARMVGHRAVSVAGECQAEPLRQAVRHNTDGYDNTGGLEGMNMLSDAEQRVASLAALGYTNREISRKIYITISTVEQHLTRIYRKLNVKGRRDLPAQFS
ncbi:AAA family ATPase [Streptosporangium sp. NPDC002721]|uniref:helix-turn-helix transcriptional regulator n=1 Tax=Streptosporangium sp. NPDC002721 TaxID=3366188 RepID=UPI00368A2911